MSASAATPPLGRGWPEPFQVEWRDEVGSTNEELLAAARQGAAHGTVLVADHQTAGRGRLGRTWSAPPGSSLLCSILVRPPPGSAPHGAVWAVGLSARAAVQELAFDDVRGFEVALKWPNDLVVEGANGSRKLAGILAEAVSSGGAPSAVVVGLGLNVGWSRPPAEVAALAVTLEELAGHPIDRAALLRSLLTSLAPLLQLWNEDPAVLLARYREHLATLGRTVRVTTVSGDVDGVAVDVTPDGALVVRTDTGLTTVSTGDVVHLRPV